MPGQLTFSGPGPAAGTQFCTICAATYKAMALAALSEQIEKIQKSGRDGQLSLTQAVQGRPGLAVAMGMVVLPVPPGFGQGAMPVFAPLCWSHLQAINMLESALMPASAGQMPTGPGGAVMLDRR